MTDQTTSVTPSMDPADLAAAGIATTFSWTCPFGCTVHVVDGVEQSHVCEGETIIESVLVGYNGESTSVQAARIAEALKPQMRERAFDVWVDGVHSGRRGLCFGVDDDVPDGEVVPPLSVPRSRTHAAVAILGLSTTWFRRVEITPKKVTVEQCRTDPKGRLAKAGDELAIASYTLDVTPDAS